MNFGSEWSGHGSIGGEHARPLHLAQAVPRGSGSRAKAGADPNRADREQARRFYEEGNAQFEAQRFEEAIASYRKALDLEPHFAPIYYNLAMALMVLGDKQEAALNLERYLELRPKAANADESRTTLKSLGPVDPSRRKSWQLEADGRESRMAARKTAVQSPGKAAAGGPAAETQLASVPPASTPSKRIVAVLPWRLLGSAGNYSQLLSGELSKALQDGGHFDSLFSVYDSDYSLSAHLSRSDLDASTERIWPGSSHYSRSRQFNATAATEIGRKLGAETVLVGYWEVREVGNDIDSQDLQLHLIHVSTGKVTSVNDRSKVSIFMGSFKSYLRECVNRLLRQYSPSP